MLFAKHEMQYNTIGNALVILLYNAPLIDGHGPTPTEDHIPRRRIRIRSFIKPRVAGRPATHAVVAGGRRLEEDVAAAAEGRTSVRHPPARPPAQLIA